MNLTKDYPMDTVNSPTNLITISRVEYNAMLESMNVVRCVALVDLDESDEGYTAFKMLQDAAEGIINRVDDN